MVNRTGVAVDVRALGARVQARRGGTRATGRWLGRFVLTQPLGAIGAVIVLALIVTAIFAPLLAPHSAKDAAFAPYLPPSAEFPMGTDHLGRDMLSRVVWGARLSLYVGLVSVAFGVTLGAFWGVVAAYFGGAADSASQRLVDILMALPPIILALSLMAALGQSVDNVIIALAILLTPTAARTLRSVALAIKESPYVEAARAAGCSHWRVIFIHVLPNTFATYIVLFTVNIAYAIVVEAALSFLGLGAPPDEPSWGGMLTAGTQALETAPWMIFFPGLAISLTVFGLNLLGDAIRDVTDPRLRGGLG
ncbi:MAG: ABC transporter permease [Candidatus Rokubacteria bacterium]|nr:ABC transporter permease [Candidatus Rokubacteria bacterium]